MAARLRPAIEELRRRAPDAPILTGLGFGGGSLHPNAAGMDEIAGVVAAFARATGLRATDRG